jgi:hypothetical protein
MVHSRALSFSLKYDAPTEFVLLQAVGALFSFYGCCSLSCKVMDCKQFIVADPPGGDLEGGR